MAALLAEIRANPDILDERGAPRRTLRLEVHATLPDRATQAIVHNLSETGLLLETHLKLNIGDHLRVELPNAGGTRSIVVWTREGFFGCEFIVPVSKAAVSAAQLISPAREVPAPRVQWRPSPAATDSYLWEHESAATRILTYVALGVALVIATAFVIALLTFPFAVS